MASLEAKIQYMQRDLNRQLKKERAFPMCLIANYNQVIKPRGDILKDRFNYFSLEEAFFNDDASFCRHWGVDPAELKAAK